MSDLDTRLTTLECDHQAFKSAVRTDLTDLDARIAATERALESFRQDIQTGFSSLNASINNLTTTALKAWPPEAVEAVESARQETIRVSATKGVMIGASLSLLGVVAVLIGLALRHHGVG